ncbi:MAG: DISARM system phospholipase D-like protein DrmC [Thermoguttaceae bacterium]|jgi:phosphatidylserine/phosphatidylglycerophosphate/cardiolipin synthase-like enzyme|nr:DISARM system phospholipase D-like protein DrmC [Thermoguttaceae bacterium]
MEQGQQIIAVEAGGLAKALPYSLMQIVGASVESCDVSDWPTTRNRVTDGIAHAHYRSLVANFLDCWKAHAADVSAEAVAASIRTAANSEKVYRDSQSVELVWTGPDAGVVSFRRTEQALLQLIDGATERVLVVSYAVYHIPRIRNSLVRAAGRGVRITVVVETPDRLEGQNTYSTLQALGADVAAKSSVFLWPLEKRTKDEHSKAGILHVKCAVSDGRNLFLTSANLTEYAFTVNMELGVLVTGGTLPEQIEKHFDRMIQMGILTKP